MLKATAITKKTSFNYEKKLKSCKTRWLTWCKKQDVPLDVQPTVETIKAFVAHMLSTDAQSKRKTALGKGNKLSTVIVSLRLLRGRVWTSQFPHWPVRELYGVTDEVEQWLVAQHSEEGVKAIAQDMYEEVLQEALQQGQQVDLAEEAASEAKKRAASMIRQATEPERTRKPFTYACLALLTDRFLTEPFAVLQTLRADAYVAVLMGTALRSFQICNAKADNEETSKHYEAPVMQHKRYRHFHHCPKQWQRPQNRWGRVQDNRSFQRAQEQGIQRP